jgi:hypothetical protein
VGGAGRKEDVTEARHIEWRRTVKKVVIPTTLLFLAVSLVGCANGGSTSCGDFRAMKHADQRTTVENMMKSRSENITPAKVDVTIGLAKSYCFVQPADKRIDSLYGGK